MTQALGKLVTFDEFVDKYPDNKGKCYELYDGVVVEMSQPTGDHEEIVVFLSTKITLEYSRLSLPYGIPKTVLVKPQENESAYSPEVLGLTCCIFVKKFYKLHNISYSQIPRFSARDKSPISDFLQSSVYDRLKYISKKLL